MTSKAKTKGNNFEREVAALLNSLLGTSEFSRAPTSGAFFGKSNAIKKAGASMHAKLTLAGDLTTPETFKYTIECKNYAYTGGPNFYAIVQGNTDSTLDKWLGQVSDDANFKNRSPCLFFKLTPKKGTYFCIHYDEAVHTQIGAYTKYTSSTGQIWAIFGLSQINLLTQ